MLPSASLEYISCPSPSLSYLVVHMMMLYFLFLTCSQSADLLLDLALITGGTDMKWGAEESEVRGGSCGIAADGCLVLGACSAQVSPRHTAGRSRVGNKWSQPRSQKLTRDFEVSLDYWWCAGQRGASV